jgi:hypothetical protein
MQKMISDNLNDIRGSSFCSIANKEAEPLITGDQVREKIQKWLSPPDPSTNHNKACEVHQKVTPRWFLEGPIYGEWKAEGSLLWAHGKRTVFRSFPIPAAHSLWFRSGIWQEHTLVGNAFSRLCRRSLHW